MNKKSLLPLLGVFIFSSFFFLSFPKKAQANVFDDIFNKVKQVFSSFQPKQISLTSKIALAPSGDVNHNGEIDGGDTVQFSYVLTNDTDQTFTFTTLKTNIDRKSLSFIHKIQGTTGIANDDKTIIIPNIRLTPHQQIKISFEALLNYFQDTDKKISTNPELLDDSGKSLAGTNLSEITAKKISKADVDKMESGIINIKK